MRINKNLDENRIFDLDYLINESKLKLNSQIFSKKIHTENYIKDRTDEITLYTNLTFNDKLSELSINGKFTVADIILMNLNEKNTKFLSDNKITLNEVLLAAQLRDEKNFQKLKYYILPKLLQNTSSTDKVTASNSVKLLDKLTEFRTNFGLNDICLSSKFVPSYYKLGVPIKINLYYEILLQKIDLNVINNHIINFLIKNNLKKCNEFEKLIFSINMSPSSFNKVINHFNFNINNLQSEKLKFNTVNFTYLIDDKKLHPKYITSLFSSLAKRNVNIDYDIICYIRKLHIDDYLNDKKNVDILKFLDILTYFKDKQSLCSLMLSHMLNKTLEQILISEKKYGDEKNIKLFIKKYIDILSQFPQEFISSYQYKNIELNENNRKFKFCDESKKTPHFLIFNFFEFLDNNDIKNLIGFLKNNFISNRNTDLDRDFFLSELKTTADYLNHFIYKKFGEDTQICSNLSNYINCLILEINETNPKLIHYKLDEYFLNDNNDNKKKSQNSNEDLLKFYFCEFYLKSIFGKSKDYRIVPNKNKLNEAVRFHYDYVNNLSKQIMQEYVKNGSFENIENKFIKDLYNKSKDAVNEILDLKDNLQILLKDIINRYNKNDDINHNNFMYDDFNTFYVFKTFVNLKKNINNIDFNLNDIREENKINSNFYESIFLFKERVNNSYLNKEKYTIDDFNDFFDGVNLLLDNQFKFNKKNKIKL